VIAKKQKRKDWPWRSTHKVKRSGERKFTKKGYGYSTSTPRLLQLWHYCYCCDQTTGMTSGPMVD